MSSYYDSFGGTDIPDDDPEGHQAELNAEADERAEHPERYTECCEQCQWADQQEDKQHANAALQNRR